MDRSANEQVEQLAGAIAAQPNAVQLYYQLAEAHWRAGDVAGYATFFRRAYDLSNTDRRKVERPSFGSAHEPSQLRERARALIGQGVAYTAVLSALAVAEAQLGDDAAVKYLVDYERFLRIGMIEPPDSASLEAFNSALAEEIKSKLKFHKAPRHLPMRDAWRHHAIEKARTPAIRKLMQVLRCWASDYMRDLPVDASHPFAAARPLEFEIVGWAVVSNGDSYHLPHIHPRAWATGVYYVVQPEASRSPGSRTGWLTIGPPRALGDAPNPDWERRDIEPIPGSLVLMPGYFPHETKPMQVDQERICVAFEIHPTESLFGRPARREL